MAPLIAKEGLGLVGDRWTKEEIICPLFPDAYLATLSKVNEENRLLAIQNRTWKQTPLHLAGDAQDPLEVKRYRDLDWDWSDDDSVHVKPVAKKCRLAPHDLTILVGKERYEYDCNGECVAYKSDFIDDEFGGNHARC